MKNFLRIIALLVFLSCGLAYSLRDASSKPLVRVGQEELASKMMSETREVVRARKLSGSQAKFPHAVCPSETYSFGLMDPLTVGTHEFQIENRGGEPLILRGGQSSCKCTLSDLKQATVAPGDTYTVKLTWNSGHANQQFEQSALVHTNDPTKRELKLSVTGEVRAVLAPLPADVNFDRLIPSETASRQLMLYSQIWSEMHIDRIESTNEHFSAEFTNESFKKSVSLDDEIHEATARAVIRVDYDGRGASGDVVGLLRVYVRPPTQWSSESAVGEEHVVGTDETADLPEIRFPRQEDGTVLIEVPVYGKVVRRLSLYGKPILGESINLGTITPSQSESKSWVLVGRIRGDEVPESVTAELTGIPGVTVVVDDVAAKNAKNSFRVTIQVEEKLRPAIYNREQAGLLKIQVNGLPSGEDAIELPVNLTVIKS